MSSNEKTSFDHIEGSFGILKNEIVVNLENWNEYLDLFSKQKSSGHIIGPDDVAGKTANGSLFYCHGKQKRILEVENIISENNRKPFLIAGNFQAAEDQDSMPELQYVKFEMRDWVSAKTGLRKRFFFFAVIFNVSLLKHAAFRFCTLPELSLVKYGEDRDDTIEFVAGQEWFLKDAQGLNIENHDESYEAIKELLKRFEILDLILKEQGLSEECKELITGIDKLFLNIMIDDPHFEPSHFLLIHQGKTVTASEFANLPHITCFDTQMAARIQNKKEQSLQQGKGITR